MDEALGSLQMNRSSILRNDSAVNAMLAGGNQILDTMRENQRSVVDRPEEPKNSAEERNLRDLQTHHRRPKPEPHRPAAAPIPLAAAGGRQPKRSLLQKKPWMKIAVWAALGAAVVLILVLLFCRRCSTEA